MAAARPCAVVRAPGRAGALVPQTSPLQGPTPQITAEGEAVLVVAHFAQCVRRMPRGMVKREPYAGALSGYHVACPGCGFVDRWSQSVQGWIEKAGALVGCATPPTCTQCGRTITIKARKIFVQ